MAAGGINCEPAALRGGVAGAALAFMGASTLGGGGLLTTCDEPGVVPRVAGERGMVSGGAAGG